MTVALSYYPQDEKSLKFFNEIKNSLGLTSTWKIAKLTRAIFVQIKRSLSPEEAVIVTKRLPYPIQILFISNGEYEETLTSIMHLDELVDNIYQEDKRCPNSLFTSEIDVLNTVILVLHKLDKFFGFMGLNVLRYSLVQELKQAATEEAA